MRRMRRHQFLSSQQDHRRSHIADIISPMHTEPFQTEPLSHVLLHTSLVKRVRRRLSYVDDDDDDDVYDAQS